MKKLTLGILLTILAVATSSCRTANGMVDRRDDDGSPFSVLAVGVACRDDASPECAQMKYDAMYKYARANGVGLLCSWRAASAFRDDKPFSESCGGKEPPTPKATMDCTGSRQKTASGSGSYDACAPIVVKGGEGTK